MILSGNSKCKLEHGEEETTSLASRRSQASHVVIARNYEYQMAYQARELRTIAIYPWFGKVLCTLA